MNKHMKKILITYILVTTLTNLFGQHNKQVTKEQLELFKKSTTYVVMDDNQMLGYNITIQAAVKKFWTITPYKFVSSNEFETLRMNRNNSFILLTKVKLTKETTGAEYLFLNMLMGDSVKDINDMPEILELPLCYNGVDENSYVYKMGIIVRFAQEHVKTLMSALFLWTYRNMTYYNLDIRDIKKKTLLVESGDLSEDVNTLDKIKPYYPFDVRIVTRDVIANAVDKQLPNTLILQVVNPGKDDAVGRSYKIIYGVDDNKMYYYNFEKISGKSPAGFLIKDFQRIAGT